MKKNILLTIILMLTVSLSTFAQKEYNMVITLNNGTTVTLGHNDIKNITFNNGEISISGDVVTTIEALQNNAAEVKHNLQAMEMETENKITNLEAYIDKVLAEVNIVNIESEKRDDEQKAEIAELDNTVKENQMQIAELQYQIEKLRAIIAEMNK